MRKKEGNKERDILNAGIKVFAKNGYHEATVAKIADQAKVGTGSIYLYFDNKRHIMQKIFENFWRKLADGIVAINGSEKNTYDKISDLVDLLFDVFTSNTHLSVLYVKEQESMLEEKKASFQVHYQKFYQEIENLIINGKDRKEIFADVDNTVLKYFIIGGIRSLIHEYSKAPKGMKVEDMRNGVLFFFKKNNV